MFEKWMGVQWEQAKKTLMKPLKELINHVFMSTCLDMSPKLCLSLGWLKMN